MFCHAYSSALPWIEDRSLLPGDILSPALGRQFDSTKPLRVGIILDDGVVSPLPPVRRVLAKVNERLQASSAIEFVPFTAYQHAKAWNIIAANYFEDAGADIRQKCRLSSEPLEPLTEWIIDQCEKATLTVGDTLQARKTARDTFRQAYAAHWNNSGIDVLIAPVTPSTAPPLGTSKYWGYTAIWNLLSYAAVSVPAASLVGETNSIQDLAKETYEPKNAIESQIFANYSTATSEGMPVGVQVVAPRFHESVLLAAAKIIVEALQN